MKYESSKLLLHSYYVLSTLNFLLSNAKIKLASKITIISCVFNCYMNFCSIHKNYDTVDNVLFI